MTEMAKVTINWTGFLGAPGYTNLYFKDFDSTDFIVQAIADGAVSKTDNWIGGIQSRIPSSVTLQTSPTVEIIEAETGELKGFLTTTPAAARVGTGTGVYSAASGAVVNWYTGGVVRGRRVRGRTFLVPISGNALSGDGTLDNTNAAALRTNTAPLISTTGAGDLGVWSRPTAPGATDGSWHLVTSFTIPDKVAVLRSRRD
jgi:hypothetical protein